MNRKYLEDVSIADSWRPLESGCPYYAFPGHAQALGVAGILTSWKDYIFKNKGKTGADQISFIFCMLFCRYLIKGQHWLVSIYIDRDGKLRILLPATAYLTAGGNFSIDMQQNTIFNHFARFYFLRSLFVFYFKIGNGIKTKKSTTHIFYKQL